MAGTGGNIMNYDLLVLSSDEFERLSHDLLEKEFNIRFERFKAGKDGGIDLRGYINEDKSIIVQCKRYQDFATLKPKLGDELEKVKKLNPAKYILITTAGLSPDNKKQIMKIFSGYIKSTTDIFGKDEIADLISKNEDIEKKHFKLWLSSVSVMQRVLHYNIHNRADFTEEEIRRDIELYVENRSLNIAQQTLKENNFVILSGNPGVGKTTLSRMLIFRYLSNEYELIEISHDIEEAMKCLDKEKKQVFYYDDFLGGNFLEDRLEKNEDKRILTFIEIVNRSKNKKLILNTREYILNQARMKYERLNHKNIDIGKCIVDVAGYTDLIKAKILYNHLFFSNIPSQYIEELLCEKNYMQIIRHRNYNPRVIEAMTFNLGSHITPKQYLMSFIENLNNPIEIWDHAFKYQIHEYSRYLLYVLATVPPMIKKENLYKCFEGINHELKCGFRRDDFYQGIRELENTFITSKLDHDGSVKINFQNPSIRDFLINHMSDDEELLRGLWRSSIGPGQMFYAFSAKEIQGKIYLNSRLINDFESIFLEKFEMFKTQVANTKFLIYMRWLNEITNFFNVEIHDRVGKLIVQEIIEVEEPHKLTGKEQEYFIELLFKVQNHVKDNLDILKILEEIVDNMDSIYGVEVIDSINKKFPEQLKIIKQNINLDSMINNLLDEELIWVDESYDSIDSLIEIVQHVQIQYNVDTDLDEVLDELYSYIENGYDEPDDYDDDMRYEEREEDSLSDIEDMFSSLADR
ncbi:restriction endonuclease [Bacillus mobilis]|uniref:restriction endonuclease n=2 Tax=Bacillus mobilis TaxID=2026190 RepID=UPI00371476BB